VKHAVTLQWRNIETALAAAGLTADQIDYCAITSTQGIELIVDDPSRLSIRLTTHPGHTAPSSLTALVEMEGGDLGPRLSRTLLDICTSERLRGTIQHGLYTRAFPEHLGKRAEDFSSCGWLDQYWPLQSSARSTVAQIAALTMGGEIGSEVTRRGFHYPVTVNLAGRPVAGYFIAHHMAHAASAYYQSGFSESAILTHDGFTNGSADLSGLLLYGIGGQIHAIAAHHLETGGVYDQVGLRLGLGDVGPAGKLMGLAAYGKPRLFDPAFVGNCYDWEARALPAWWDHCLSRARSLGYDMEPLGDPAQPTAAINADIAASTQRLMEETYLLVARALDTILRQSGRTVSNLCLSGGCALNCPSNSRVRLEGPFEHVFIEPGCDDSGLAIGAALYLCHNVLDQPVRQQEPATPFLGVAVSGTRIEQTLADAGEAIQYERCPETEVRAAQDLMANRVVGWFEGRSEIGPRALGHRSILADARIADNWSRVNRIKGRDWWRPFAPAVLESEAAAWFEGMPAQSPYMLFNAKVRSNRIPAVTHVDGTARVQTVDQSCGRFFTLLQRFHEQTGVPVVLNTSFNGPGEPIVETPEDALRFMRQSELDVLYLDGYRVTRRTTPD
jgi:carbamoyltransferase